MVTAGCTVSVAAADRTVPTRLLTFARNCVPLCATAVSGIISEPSAMTKFSSSSAIGCQKPPTRRSQVSCGAGRPVKPVVSTAGVPALTVTERGGVRIVGTDSTVSVATSETTVPIALTATTRTWVPSSAVPASRVRVGPVAPSTSAKRRAPGALTCHWRSPVDPSSSAAEKSAGRVPWPAASVTVASAGSVPSSGVRPPRSRRCT